MIIINYNNDDDNGVTYCLIKIYFLVERVKISDFIYLK